jgi:hypothetical protein
LQERRAESCDKNNARSVFLSKLGWDSAATDDANAHGEICVVKGLRLALLSGKWV